MVAPPDAVKSHFQLWQLKMFEEAGVVASGSKEGQASLCEFQTSNQGCYTEKHLLEGERCVCAKMSENVYRCSLCGIRVYSSKLENPSFASCSLSAQFLCEVFLRLPPRPFCLL